MKKSRVFCFFSVSAALLLVFLLFLPHLGLHRPILVHALGVTKNSACANAVSRWDRLQSNAAFLYVKFYPGLGRAFKESDNNLIGFSLGKIKCQVGLPGYDEEAFRVNRMIDLALANGEDIDSITPLGYPNLHMAVLAGNHFVVEHLLDKGATLNMEVPYSTDFATQGETALSVAKKLQNSGVDRKKIIGILEAR